MDAYVTKPQKCSWLYDVCYDVKHPRAITVV